MDWPTKRQPVSSQSSGFQCGIDEPYKANRQVELQIDTNAKTKRVFPNISPNITSIYVEKLRHFARTSGSGVLFSWSATVINSEGGPEGWGGGIYPGASECTSPPPPERIEILHSVMVWRCKFPGNSITSAQSCKIQNREKCLNSTLFWNRVLHRAA